MQSTEIFAQLVQIIADLRGENGCPWDKQQTHETLKKNLLEEAYEAIEAIDLHSPEKLKEELGDLMMVQLLHAQIAADEGTFRIEDVLQAITEKLIRRHPHVFGDLEVEDTDQIVANWEAIKRQEKSHASRQSVLDGVPSPLPALMAAQKLQKRAARVGFDWSDVRDMLPKISEELDELTAAVQKGNLEETELEFGDLLFSMVNLARFLGIEAEDALRRSNAKFVARFQKMEQILRDRDERFEEHDLESLDRIWESVKAPKTDP